jgi:uncharacterized MAPEG superfamily protein
MTRTTNARVAGAAYLLYIAVALPAMILFGKATGAPDIVDKLAGIATDATAVRVTIVLNLISCFAALVLAVTLYGITRDEDQELATLGMVCRVAEGVVGGSFPSVVALLWLATSGGTGAPEPAAAQTLTGFLLHMGDWGTLVAATFFAVGSTVFSYLLLRGRMIPRALAWIGVIGSALLVVVLPLQLAGFISGTVTQLAWIPVALFELTLAPWLLIKGVPVYIQS